MPRQQQSFFNMARGPWPMARTYRQAAQQGALREERDGLVREELGHATARVQGRRVVAGQPPRQRRRRVGLELQLSRP